MQLFKSPPFITCHIELQGQENRKADILGLENDLSNEAAELLLDEDTQIVSWQIVFLSRLVTLTRALLSRNWQFWSPMKI